MTPDPILDGLEREARVELLKYSVGRAIHCPTCSRILDYRRAVLLVPDHNHGAGISCALCWDDTVRRMEEKHGKERVQAYFAEFNSLELIDGREF